MEDEAIPCGNTIRQNYSQGIILEETSSAEIYSNLIYANVKANIALGGESSGETIIKFNQITESKHEGIFVIYGEQDLMIFMNRV